MVGGLGFIVSLYMEYGFGYVVIRSPYTPYSIYLRGTIGFCLKVGVCRVKGLAIDVRGLRVYTSKTCMVVSRNRGSYVW